jgi:hypothetical protein
MNEEQHVIGGETSPGEHFHREEVGACQDGHMGGNEILPGGFLASLGRRSDPVSAKDVSHRLIGDWMAEIGKRSDDAVVSPTGVLSGEADNERLHFRCDAGPAWSSAEFGAVELVGNEPPVPSKDGVGFGDTGYLLEHSATEPFADLSEVDLSGSERRIRAGRCFRRTRFSAIRYSFWSRSF